MHNLILVIIPVYNVEKYLVRCIDSVINQTYSNLEIVLVNDGSSDNSHLICDEYAQKDKLIKVFHKHNEGLSRARNVGLSNSNGDYLFFLDSDDYLPLDALGGLLQVAQQYKVQLVQFFLRHVRDAGNEYAIKSLSAIENSEQIVFIGDQEITKFMMFDCQHAVSKLYERSLLIDNNLRFEDGKYWEDVLWHWKTLFNVLQKAAIYKNVTYYYYVRSGSTCNSSSIKHLEDSLYAINTVNQAVVQRSLESNYLHTIQRKITNLVVSAISQLSRLTELNTKEKLRYIKILKNYKKYISLKPLTKELAIHLPVVLLHPFISVVYLNICGIFKYTELYQKSL